MNSKKLVAGLLSISFVGMLSWYIANHDTKTVVQAEKQNNVISEEKTKKTKEIASKDIYGTSETENSWVKDPTVPENLLIKGLTSVVQLKVLSIGEAEILPKIGDFYSQDPYTPIQVEVIDTISGNPMSGEKTIYINGGDIKISNLENSLDKGTSQKMGLDNLTSKQKETEYISYVSDHDYKMKTGKDYTVILVKQADDFYTVIGNGYGIFKASNSKRTNMFKNVLTGKESDLQF